MKQKSKSKPILTWDEYALLVTALAFYRDYSSDKKNYKEIKKMFNKLISFLKDETNRT